jgi:predicted metalloprotease
MHWDEDHESSDLIDRRGEESSPTNIGGLLWLLPMLMRSPLGWLVIIAFLGFSLFKGVARGLFSGNTAATSSSVVSNVRDPEAHFVAFVLDDVQNSWAQVFATGGQTYTRSKLVLFSNSIDTGCGYGKSATGPFYCPEDRRVYIDLGFYRELSGKLGARGQFAKAYVVAHEIGHHVQHILGSSNRAGSHSAGANGGSVRFELQADCYAGIWAQSTAQRSILEQGDIESALNAAASIGDDRLQRQATGTVSPESFTHGTSQQRIHWFQTGYQTGSVRACDTFAATKL